MRLQRQSNQQFITLDISTAVGQGGEARIFAVPHDESLVAKVYHKHTCTPVHKLEAMLANPPENPLANLGKIAIAWPVDLLRTDNGQTVVGFLMPYVKGMHSILEFYNPKTRRQKDPHFSYLYLHRTARNLAAAVGALHARGYCVGDVNESNILVSNTALVTLVDTDSFQVREPNSDIIYRCPVGKPEFTPPELQSQNFGELDRIPEHDLFGLAVLIFQLLMEGTHPFAGVFEGKGEPPPCEARIKAGDFAYCKGRSVPYRPAPIAPPFEILHPTLQQLFITCFEQGHKQPQLRPNAETWQKALIEAENALATCKANVYHRYGNHLNSCPWCDRTTLLGGRDPFPSAAAVAEKKYLQPSPKKVTSRVKKNLSPNYTRQTLTRRSALINQTPVQKKFGTFFIGLFGIALLGCLEVAVTVISLDTGDANSTWIENGNTTAIGQNSTQDESSYYRQGQVYYNLGDYEAAIENFTELLQLDPHNDKIYVERGNAYYQKAQNSSDPGKEYRAAINDFSQAIRLNPQAADEAYVKRGLIRFEIATFSKDLEQEYKAAIEDFDQALRLNSKNAEAYVNRGNVRYKLAQYNKDFDQGYKAAIDDFSQALSLNSELAEAYSQRGLIRYEIARNSSKDYREAIDDLQKAAGLFLERKDINHYQQTLKSICIALDNNCTSFLQNPQKFIKSNGKSKEITDK